MRYVCYLSKERIDSLFETAFDGIVDEVKATSSRSASGDGEVGFGAVLHLVKAGLKFGGKVASSTETKRRQTAISRLTAVLEAIQEHATVADLKIVISQRRPFDADWYEVTARMRVPAWDPASAAVDLIADIEGFTLKLSCAKENFSGLYREGDRMIPTSTNRYLFEGSLALPMTGLIRLAGTDLERRLLFASPLYLILNPVDENLGEYNDVEI